MCVRNLRSLLICIAYRVLFYTVVTPACGFSLTLRIAEKRVEQAIYGEEGLTVCSGIVQG